MNKVPKIQEDAETEKFLAEAKEIRDAEIRRMSADEVTTAELEAEAFQAQFDHDPNPYEGTYSEE